ncbi:MAG: hypothetical protein GY821_08500 [Gammaproteobacteria bacterium]|nr:hypothetical protein [Gammaproteobacteria bacterium]
MTTEPVAVFERLMRYKKHLLRHNPMVTVESRLFITAIYDRDFAHELQALFQQPQSYLSSAACQTIKHDRTSSLFSLRLAAFHWVVKRYNFRGWLRLLKRCFRISRARRSWLNAHLLQQVGIATVKPLAFFEQRCGFLRFKSYFVAEHLDGVLLNDYFASDADAVEKTAVADRVITLLEQLVSYGIHHGDLKATNILLHQGRPRLLDLDALRFYPDSNNKKFKRLFAKDIKRFMQNWQQLPEADRLFSQRLNKLQQYTAVAFQMSTERAYKRAEQCAQQYSQHGDDHFGHD